jgi:hypothetical protein
MTSCLADPRSTGRICIQRHSLAEEARWSPVPASSFAFLLSSRGQGTFEAEFGAQPTHVEDCLCYNGYEEWWGQFQFSPWLGFVPRALP